MAYKASGAAYAVALRSTYYTLGNSPRKGSSSGRRGDTDLSSDPRLSTNDMDGLAAAARRPCVARLSARLTFLRSARLVVGTRSTKWRSLPSSLRLALAGQAATRRQGAAAVIPGTGKGFRVPDPLGGHMRQTAVTTVSLA